jgi:uncharacterized protein
MTAVQPPGSVPGARVSPEAATTPTSPFADPAPLGLAGFALTTFVLSFMNTDIFKAEPVVFGLALFYGGVAQLLAGMWEFTRGNTFGATAFSSYGAFWLSFWYLTGHTDLSGVGAHDAQKGIGLYLLAWGIFTLLMLAAALKTNLALISVLALLAATYIILGIGWFQLSATETTDGIIKFGGWVGLVTAAAAWYTAFAIVLNATNKRTVLPLMPRE